MNREAAARSVEHASISPHKSAWMLAFSLLMVLLTAGFGSQFTPDEWYAALEKPPLNPPGWVFGPVWTTLYILMAIAAWLLWREEGRAAVPLALTLYGGQLFLNAIWSPLFFGLRLPGLALVDILALWVVLTATLVLFWRLKPIAGAMLVPYLAWVSFATYLNAGIWWLNRG